MNADEMPFTGLFTPEEPDEGGGYSAQCLEILGAISCGDTLDEAYANLQEALVCMCMDEMPEQIAAWIAESAGSVRENLLFHIEHPELTVNTTIVKPIGIPRAPIEDPEWNEAREASYEGMQLHLSRC